MKRALKYLIAAIMLLAVASGAAFGQNRKAARKKSKEKVSVAEHRSSMMQFIVEGGDTVFIGNSLPAARIFERIGKQKGKDWRQYYRLVYNFSKVYPYAVAAKGLLDDVDSTILAEDLKRGKREKYISLMQDRLFATYETPFRNMTITQGALMMKLIDREVSKSAFSIIKDYKNSMAAGFWQGIAKLYNMDLKAPYDPEGADAETEELVQIWERGEFEAVYYSLFGEYPDIPVIPPDFYK